jgi:hypothetical protein
MIQRNRSACKNVKIFTHHIGSKGALRRGTVVFFNNNNNNSVIGGGRVFLNTLLVQEIILVLE